MANDEAIEQFVGVTGADNETAKFYLDSSKGDLNVLYYHGVK